MTLAEKILTLATKIEANEAQYNLDRETAKISTLSSSYLNKYEHLTSQDIASKPEVIEQKQFEHSPLGQVFNEG